MIVQPSKKFVGNLEVTGLISSYGQIFKQTCHRMENMDIPLWHFRKKVEKEVVFGCSGMTILIAQLYKENASVAQLITDMSVNRRVSVYFLKTAYFLWKPPPHLGSWINT